MTKDEFGSRRAKAARLGIEPLEGRQLLSGATATSQNVSFGHATYTVSVSGPGAVSVRSVGNGQYGITLSGTTVGSTVAVQQVKTSGKFAGVGLPVGRVDVASGTLGQFDGLGTVDLLGTFSVSGSIGSIQVGSIGRSAKIKVPSGVGSLLVSGAINLGPAGQVSLGSVTGNIQAGSISLAGGSIRVAGNLGGLTVGSFSATAGGSLLVGQDAGAVSIGGNAYLAGGGSLAIGLDAQSLRFGGGLTLDPGGRIFVGRDVLAPLSIGGQVGLNAGQFYVGRDVTGAVTINGDLSAANGGNLTVGRDLAAGLSVNGNVDLLAGAALVVGRDAGRTTGSTGLSVNGSVVIASGGSIAVGGNLEGFLVAGTIQGSGTDSIDLSVGLNLDNWSVNGGVPGLGGVHGFNADVTKDISGINILHGLFNDYITAGVLITNGTIGPDGPVAVFDTEIRSGVQITNLTFNGQVESDRPTNPLGRRTRIIAGEDRSGTFTLGGNIDNTIITGSLIDAAVVADVQPYGGHGSETINPAPPPAPGSLDYYDAPAGNQYVTALGANLGLPFAAPPFNTRTDPAVHDTVLPGSINKSFFVKPTTSTTNGVTTTTVNPPTRSSALGGVFTTAHANNSDYAGFFAADTTGVYAGTLPSS